MQPGRNAGRPSHICESNQYEVQDIDKITVHSLWNTLRERCLLVGGGLLDFTRSQVAGQQLGM